MDRKVEIKFNCGHTFVGEELLPSDHWVLEYAAISADEVLRISELSQDCFLCESKQKTLTYYAQHQLVPPLRRTA